MDSILNSVKLKVGITSDDTSFDDTIVDDINNAFFVVYQLGVGPTSPFVIEDSSAEWGDFSTTIDKLAIVKSYVKNKVKLEFDPPTNSTVLQSLTESIKECESRLIYEVDKS